MASIDTEIAAFEQMRSSLEAEHLGEWVLIHDSDLVSTFPTFDDAAQLAVAKFGRGPYLIRQIGAASVVLPASVMYHPVHG
jgi:hypothetical protein